MLKDVQWNRLPAFVLALVAYVVSVKTLLYLIGFLSNRYVSRGIDDGQASEPSTALLVDSALLIAFFIVHSLMARRRFKSWQVRFLQPTVERSVYVLVSCLQLWMIFVWWRPIPVPVWNVETPWLARSIWGLAIAAWLTSLLAIRNLGHFRLFGLQRPWRRLRGRNEGEDSLIQTGIHGVIGHPMYLGFLVGVWATPEMSRGHLLFSVASAIYILVGIRMEERKLESTFGDEFRRYRAEVPWFLPRKFLPRWMSR